MLRIKTKQQRVIRIVSENIPSFSSDLGLESVTVKFLKTVQSVRFEVQFRLASVVVVEFAIKVMAQFNLKKTIQILLD